jgi:large subunit ribosomal protein L32e
LDNKVRKRIKGWPPRVSAGYRGPRIARDLHPSGLKQVLVFNAEGIKEIDPGTQAIYIAHTVGRRKRAKILTEARKKKITVLNVKEAKKEVEKPEEVTEEVGEDGLEESEATAETKEPEQRDTSVGAKKRKKKE